MYNTVFARFSKATKSLVKTQLFVHSLVLFLVVPILFRAEMSMENNIQHPGSDPKMINFVVYSSVLTDVYLTKYKNAIKAYKNQ